MRGLVGDADDAVHALAIRPLLVGVGRVGGELDALAGAALGGGGAPGGLPPAQVEMLDKRPSIDLNTLAADGALGQFIAAMDWAYDQAAAGAQSLPSTSIEQASSPGGPASSHSKSFSARRMTVRSALTHSPAAGCWETTVQLRSSTSARPCPLASSSARL